MSSKVIGTFIKSGEKYIGTVKTLQLHTQIRIEPALERENAKAPDYRVVANGDYELGAGWLNQSENGGQYITVRLDDPSFEQPITARLVARKDAEDYLLFWNR